MHALTTGIEEGHVLFDQRGPQSQNKGFKKYLDILNVTSTASLCIFRTRAILLHYSFGVLIKWAKYSKIYAFCLVFFQNLAKFDQIC